MHIRVNALLFNETILALHAWSEAIMRGPLLCPEKKVPTEKIVELKFLSYGGTDTSSGEQYYQVCVDNDTVYECSVKDVIPESALDMNVNGEKIIFLYIKKEDPVEA